MVSEINIGRWELTVGSVGVMKEDGDIVMTINNDFIVGTQLIMV